VSDGAIRIDGKDIRDVTQRSIHENIGIVQQEVFLFADTIFENIRFGRNISEADVQKATELGVDEIIPVEMERSIVKLTNDKIEKKLERWTKICKEASEQSKRTDIPTITRVKKLSELKDLDGLKMVCSTTEKENLLKKFLTDNTNYDKINIVIGPEGGISPREEDKLVELGFQRVSLGKRIMRVETVPMFVLSVLNYEFME
jgi:16S rRNA (uracil1498-N3)-methyltransferase